MGIVKSYFSVFLGVLNARYDVSHTNLTKLINLDAFRKKITFEKRLF